MRNRAAALLIVLPLLMLSSCIGIESEFRFDADGSGTLSLTYRVSQMVKDIDASGDAHTLPLPVSREDFQRAVAASQGLRLLSYQRSEDEKDVTIRASLAFDRVEQADGVGKGGDFSLVQEGEAQVFRCVLSPGGPPPDQDTLELIRLLFQDYELSFVVRAPRKISSHSLGTLAPDERSVSYSIAVADLLSNPQPQTLEVRW